MLVCLVVSDEWNVHADVGMRLPAAVKAMSIAVFMDVTFAPSIRVKERRCVCASTTAMLLEYNQCFAYLNN
jgi:hypothetical protein